MNDGPSHTFQIFRAGIRSPVFLAWILFLIQGFFYAAFLPPWEGFDEPIHLAYIAFLHDERKLPVLGESTISNEIQSSINSLPVSRSLDPYSTRRFETFFTVSQTKAEQGQSGAAPLYEAQQPPAYYVLMLLPYHLARSGSILTRLQVIRFTSVFLASFFVFFAFGFIRGVFHAASTANLTLFTIIAFPMLYANVARVSNESLGLLLFTVVCYLAMRLKMEFSWKIVLALGVVVGLGLLTKLYFLCALAPLVVVAMVKAWRSPGRRLDVLVKLAVLLAIAFVLAAPWLLRTHRLYHVWWLSYEAVALKNVSAASMILEMAKMRWGHEFAVLFRSFVWVGNWSFLDLPKSIYDFTRILFAGAGIGLILLLVRRFKDSMDSLGLSFLFVMTFLLAFMQFATVSFMVRQALGGAGGWYLYPIIVPITVLIVSGLTAWTPSPMKSHVAVVGLILSLTLINLYGVFVRLMPYYAGFSVSGRRRAEDFRVLVSSPWENFKVITDRLAMLKPHWLDATILRAGCVVFVLAVVVVAVLPWMQVKRWNQSGEI